MGSTRFGVDSFWRRPTTSSIHSQARACCSTTYAGLAAVESELVRPFKAYLIPGNGVATSRAYRKWTQTQGNPPNQDTARVDCKSYQQCSGDQSFVHSQVE